MIINNISIQKIDSKRYLIKNEYQYKGVIVDSSKLASKIVLDYLDKLKEKK